MARAASRYFARLTEVSAIASARAVGVAVPDSKEVAHDRRFSNEFWANNPFFSGLRGAYDALAEYADAVLAIGLEDLEPSVARKAEFAVRSMLDGAAPANFLFTNPVALEKAAKTGGVSVAQGYANFLEDLVQNRGLPRQVDREAFTVGVDLALTPGRVVLRTDLIELIQYAPQTEQVHEIPLLCSPPWINRYYVMDLAPGRSFIEWAVQHGHTVFSISYRNPDASMAETTYDDYVSAARSAITAIKDITGAPRVNIAGLCLGGILTLVLLGVLAAEGNDSIGAATVLNTIADFSDPGVLGVFTDPASVEHLAAEMSKQGYLDASTIADMFTVLRPNDLIWNYVSSRWLMGEDAPKFDILAWNDDAVRLPATMYITYLRAFYVNNDLAGGRFRIGDSVVRLDKVPNDLYILAAENDHITPWRSAYATTQLAGGAITFVRSSAGHIAGIVNPPSKKAAYWTNEELPATPEEWAATATKHAGSWWEHWIEWISNRAGPLVAPPPLGNARYAPLEAAPGQYVFS
jgi:polyhydroxyalkanoate synthase